MGTNRRVAHRAIRVISPPTESRITPCEPLTTVRAATDGYLFLMKGGSTAEVLLWPENYEPSR